MEYNSNYKNKMFQEKGIDQNQQSQNEEILNSKFNKLYHSLNPKIPDNYSLPQNFLNLLRRILSTNFSVLKTDESAIVNSLLDNIYKSSNYNNDVLNHFQNLYSKLTKKKTLQKRWAILYMLNSLSKNNFKSLNFNATNTLQQNYMDMNIPISNNLSMGNDLSEMTNTNIKFGRYENLNSDNKKYLNNLSPISNINERVFEDQNLMNFNNKNLGNFSINNNIIVNQNKTSLKITEKDIINDLLFVFEGINGKYIAYDAAEDSYILNKLIPWSEEIYNIVNSLAEIGWLYKKSKSYLDYFKESNIQSQFIKSFIYSIQNELNEYFKLISFLRKLNSNQNQNLNLKKIVLWTLIPKETLKWIAACCESIHALKGTSVLSQIYSFVNFGGCNDFLNNILNEVSKPFINFIFNWIKYGELQDPNKEFFVDILTGIKEDDIWNLQYQLIGKNVPNFMKREPTLKIFEVGKCIHFIRNYCKENYNLSNIKPIIINLLQKFSEQKKTNEQQEFQMDLDDVDNIKKDEEINLNNKQNNENNFDYGFEEDKIMFEIESYQSCLNFIDYIFDPSQQDNLLNMSIINEIIFNIDVIHKIINKDLVRIIFTKFNFIKNLECVNKFLLLGQGDMMQTLMESLFEELDKPANLIFKHNLQSNLESSIRASNAQYIDQECLQKLNIKLISASVGDNGWDIFCLEYKTNLPLNVIFTSRLLKDYQKLFLFFWKIKRIEYSQNNQIWKKIRTFSQLLKNKTDFINKAIKISIHFNQEIIHFMSNLHTYLALEVLETQYKDLIIDLSKVNNLDELINKHKHFVENIKKQCLLDQENDIYKKINNIFDIILRFRTIHELLYERLMEQSYDNSGNNDYNRNKSIKEYLQQIKIFYKTFITQIIELINIIKLLGKNNLKYFPDKLDFNSYYSSLEKDEEEKKNLEALNKINAEEQKKKILLDNDQDQDSNIVNNSNSNNINNNMNEEEEEEQNINNNNSNEPEDNIQKENISDEEMEIDDHNNNINNNEVEEEIKPNDNNNIYLNRMNQNNIQNSANIFGKVTNFYSTSGNNNNILNNNNNNQVYMSGIKINKNNNIKIITKKKEKLKKDEDNDEINEIPEYNKPKLDDEDNKEGKFDQQDLIYDKNEVLQKTQKAPKYNYLNNNIQKENYSFKTMTKNKPYINYNINSDIQDEDQITTDINPKIFGISAKGKGKKDTGSK